MFIMLFYLFLSSAWDTALRGCVVIVGLIYFSQSQSISVQFEIEDDRFISKVFVGSTARDSATIHLAVVSML